MLQLRTDEPAAAMPLTVMVDECARGRRTQLINQLGVCTNGGRKGGTRGNPAVRKAVKAAGRSAIDTDANVGASTNSVVKAQLAAQ